MDTRNERLRFVSAIMEFVVGIPFDPEVCARYIFIKSLDEKSYLFEDEELHKLIGVLGGMSAGEEFLLAG